MSKLSVVLRALTGAARPNLRVRIKNVDTDAYVLDTDDDTLVDNGDGSYTSASDVSAIVYSVYTGDTATLVSGYEERFHPGEGEDLDGTVKSMIFSPTTQPSASKGKIYFNNSDGIFYYYDGSSWIAEKFIPDAGDGRALIGTGTDFNGLYVLNEDTGSSIKTLEVVHKSRGTNPGAGGPGPSAAMFVHSYTDADDNTPEFHPVRVDNVGRGGSILYLANAYNTNTRPDLTGNSDETSSNSDYLQCFEARAPHGFPAVSSCEIFKITYDGELYWPGGQRAGGSNENDPAKFLWGGNPDYMNASNYAFEFKTSYGFKDGLERFATFKAGSEEWMSWHASTDPNLLCWDFGAGFDTGIRITAVDGYFNIYINDTSERFKITQGSSTTNYFHQYSQDTAPTAVDIGEMWFDEILKKPFWWAGTYWVDATGTERPQV